MKKLTTLILAPLLCSQGLLAQPSALYRDQVLGIPGGALIDEGGAAYYRDIQLIEDGAGNFRIVHAEPTALAQVDRVNVAQRDGEVHIEVAGTMATPCTELLDPIVSVKEQAVTVVLPETRPTSDYCILMLEAFETSFPLKAGELSPGRYSLEVNGLRSEFVI